MNDVSYQEYWAEVAYLAETVLHDVVEEQVLDGVDPDPEYVREHVSDRLWETIDGHQWVIYTAYNYDVLKLSDNDSYYIDNFGSEGLVDGPGGPLNTGALAFGALYGDVSDALWPNFDEWCKQLEESA